MRKSFLVLSVAASFLLAGDIKVELEKTINNTSKIGAKVAEVVQLETLNKIYIARLQMPDGKEIPVFSASDGKSFFGFTTVMYTPNEKDRQKIDTLLQKITETNNKFTQIDKQKKEAEQKLAESKINAKLKELLPTFPKERFVELKSENPDAKKTITIVTDPECPYCNQELSQITKRLKDSNVRMIFAPVHDTPAYVKSELILKEIKKNSTNQEKIAILSKYYSNPPLSEDQLKMDISGTRDNANKLFAQGLIKGVPYIYEE